VSFTGRIEAKDRVPISFRISGRLAERLVNVGDRVQDGQVIARLEPENELNELRSAQATLSMADSRLRQADNHYRRQTRLYDQGHTSRADLELAKQGRVAAQAQVDSARAQVRIAQEVVGFTTLMADAPGVVTAVGAEAGEVVATGRMIVTLARRDGRDGVFDVSEDIVRSVALDAPVLVRLSANPATTVQGRVREVSPEADPVTRTFQVRVGLTDPPPTFRLGAAVTAIVRGSPATILSVPSTAVTKQGKDAVAWVVDPKSLTISARKLEVASSDPAMTYVTNGLSIGDIVIAAGANSLREGQAVRLIGAETR
jgi:RND family efflux transporter MFP subunit